MDDVKAYQYITQQQSDELAELFNRPDAQEIVEAARTTKFELWIGDCASAWRWPVSTLRYHLYHNHGYPLPEGWAVDR